MKLRALFKVKAHRPRLFAAGTAQERDSGDKTVVFAAPSEPGYGHAELVIGRDDVQHFPVGAIVTIEVANPAAKPHYAKEE